mmetsp:Transcript_12050/g.15385  ORF Transcript_12050/g.15385 Transcript_12050/m.15385 type:complete len:195 (-) Transcript_12050:395-979(-)
MLVSCTAMTLMMRVPFHIERQDRCSLLLRCVLDLTAYIGIVFALPLVPLIVQSTIFNTAPFWASILGCFVLGELITRFELFAMVLSFGGILCICFSAQKNSSGAEIEAAEGASPAALEAAEADSGNQLLGEAIVLVVSWCFAGVTILTRKMQKLHFTIVLFYQSCLAIPVTLFLIFGEAWANDHAVRLSSYTMG